MDGPLSLLGAPAPPAFAELDPWVLAGSLLGGLALFLHGMQQLTDALQRLAGDGLRVLLARLTHRPWTAALSGALVTAVIQSSSVTTVLVVGFVSAGLMSLEQSVGVILGANVGSTLTAQLVAFHVTDWALPLVALGFGLALVGRERRLSSFGEMLLGLGVLFLGMGVMSDATAPLRTDPRFVDLMGRLDSPLLGLAVAAGFTALVQSSSATTGIVIVLATQGFVSLEAGIALALGANVGTCATALLASLGRERPALRAALVHVTFNGLGALLWLPAIPLLVRLVLAVSPARPELEGVARAAAEVPRQIANAHTIFNAVNLLLVLPFTGVLSRFVLRCVPERPSEAPDDPLGSLLDPRLLEVPSLAVERVRLAVGEFGSELRRALGFLEDLEGSVAAEGPDPVPRARARLAALGPHHEQLVRYASRLNARNPDPADSERLSHLLLAAGHVITLSELVSAQLLPALGILRRTARPAEEAGAAPEPGAAPHAAPRAAEDLTVRTAALARDVLDQFDRAVRSLEPDGRDLAEGVLASKSEMRARCEDLAARATSRMVAGGPSGSVQRARAWLSLAEGLRRVQATARRVAREGHPPVDPGPGAEGA